MFKMMIGTALVASSMAVLADGDFEFEHDYVEETRRIVVDLSEQRFYLYRNEEVVYSGRVSTGQRDFPTPAFESVVGVKKADKVSSIYYKNGTKVPPELRWTPQALKNGAPMTWAVQLNGNIFSHIGKLPAAEKVRPNYGYSHGCVRMNPKDAKYVFYFLQPGDRVTVQQ